MGLFFIAGVSGTGKTTLMRELQRRGEEAYDMDSECVRLSKTTNEILSYEDAKKEGYNWIYPKKALRRVKELSSTKDVFLLGIVDNLQEIKHVATEFIWMSIPLDTLVQRLDSREKEYGKSERERKLILDLYQGMSKSLDQTTFTLDATKPVEIIADKLLAHVNSAGRSSDTDHRKSSVTQSR